MYARTTTIDAEPSSVDAGIAQVRDAVIPALEALDGYIGLSLLVDRASGQCIATSAWQSEEDLRSSMSTARQIRERAAQAFGGSPDVAEWEIAVMHREHQSSEGACVRAIWVQVSPDMVDRGIDIFKMSVLPALEDLEGLCSASLLVDRASGRAVSSVAYDSRDALENNRDALDALRASTTQDAGARVLDERDFELAIARLRVPEMA